MAARNNNQSKYILNIDITIADFSFKIAIPRSTETVNTEAERKVAKNEARRSTTVRTSKGQNVRASK